MEARGQNQVIMAQVPLSEMFGYATDLRARTQGRATYTMQFDSYQQTPASVQEEIVARIRGECSRSADRNRKSSTVEGTSWLRPSSSGQSPT